MEHDQRIEREREREREREIIMGCREIDYL